MTRAAYGVVLALVCSGPVARAEGASATGPEVAPRYVGAALTAHEGGGLGGYELTTLGGDVFTGYRFSRWLSLEGFFDARVATSPSSNHEGYGAVCAGGWSNLRTTTFGARLLMHVVHRPAFDLSVVPSIAGGLTLDQGAFFVAGVEPSGGCGVVPITRVGGAVSGGLGVAFEVRSSRWLAWRATFETSIDAGSAVTAGYAVVSLGGYVGPVFRL